jgi:hypothetical protein
LLGSVRNVRNLSLVPVPTINYDVSSDANYQVSDDDDDDIYLANVQ